MYKVNQTVMPFPKGTETGLYYLVNDPELVKDFHCVVNGHNFQRELNLAHVKEIKDAILGKRKEDIAMFNKYGVKYEGEFIHAIRVDRKTGIVADGNHTLHAFREAWAEGSKAYMKVMLIDLPTDEEELLLWVIKDINNSQLPWNIFDYTLTAANTGNVSVINLVEFAKSHPLCMRGKKALKISVRTAGCFLKGENVTNSIKGNDISVTQDDIDFGEQMYEEIDAMMNELKYTKNNWFECFIKAWYSIRKDDVVYNKIINNTGFDTFLKHIKKLSIDWQLISRKAYWEKMFRTALGVLDTKVNYTHEWEKAA